MYRQFFAITIITSYYFLANTTICFVLQKKFILHRHLSHFVQAAEPENILAFNDIFSFKLCHSRSYVIICKSAVETEMACPPDPVFCYWFILCTAVKQGNE